MLWESHAEVQGAGRAGRAPALTPATAVEDEASESCTTLLPRVEKGDLCTKCDSHT